jgi:hypothetical protein
MGSIKREFVCIPIHVCLLCVFAEVGHHNLMHNSWLHIIEVFELTGLVTGALSTIVTFVGRGFSPSRHQSDDRDCRRNSSKHAC